MKKLTVLREDFTPNLWWVRFSRTESFPNRFIDDWWFNGTEESNRLYEAHKSILIRDGPFGYKIGFEDPSDATFFLLKFS